MADYRINIGNGSVVISTYGDHRDAEETMHKIIRAVTAGQIFVEEKTEQWAKVPT